MSSIVFHTPTDTRTIYNISEITSVTKGNELWKISFYDEQGLYDYWYIGLDADETHDGVPDSVTFGGMTFVGRAGIEKLASIPPDMLNAAEETYSSLEDLNG